MQVQTQLDRQVDIYLVQQLKNDPLQSHSEVILRNVFLTTKRKHCIITRKERVGFLLDAQDIPITN